MNNNRNSLRDLTRTTNENVSATTTNSNVSTLAFNRSRNFEFLAFKIEFDSIAKYTILLIRKGVRLVEGVSNQLMNVSNDDDD